MAPDPILPDTNLWPTVAWLALVIFVVGASMMHAANRGRWGWVVLLALAPPFALPIYWLTAPRDRVRADV